MPHWFRAWSQKRTPGLLPISLVLTGLSFAISVSAWSTFLNPDEILHYLLADQPSLRLAYEASLTTAHPPLLILFLYYWRMLGHAEWILRLPSVLAGTAFCGLFSRLSKVASRSAALTGLAATLVLAVAHSPFGRSSAVSLCCCVFRRRSLFPGTRVFGKVRAHDSAFLCRPVPCPPDSLLRPDLRAQHRDLRTDPAHSWKYSRDGHHMDDRASDSSGAMRFLVRNPHFTAEDLGSAT